MGIFLSSAHIAQKVSPSNLQVAHNDFFLIFLSKSVDNNYMSTNVRESSVSLIYSILCEINVTLDSRTLVLI